MSVRYGFVVNISKLHYLVLELFGLFMPAFISLSIRV